MAIIRDWMHDASDDIRESTGDLENTEIHEIIAKHCPFKPNVAYMPVPRCDSCKWWHGGADGLNESLDGRKTCTEPTVPGEQMDEFMTLPGFGCARWEGK